MIFPALIIIASTLLIIAGFIKTKILKNISVYLALSVYSFLVSFRSFSGSDTFVYLNIYSQIEIEHVYPFIEPGLKWVFGLMHFFDFPYDVVNYIQGSLVFISLCFLTKNKSPFVVVLYIALIGINVDFSTLRQSLSVHIFIIFLWLFKNKLLSTIFSAMFHLSAIFSFIANVVNVKLSIWKVVALVCVAIVLKLLFLDRYLAVGQDFVFRTDLLFLIQSFALIFLMFLMGYDKKSLAYIFIISFVPIGYRLILFFIVLSPIDINRWSNKTLVGKLLLSVLLMFFVSLKMYLFSVQSLANDGLNSVVLFYEKFNKM